MFTRFLVFASCSFAFFLQGCGNSSGPGGNSSGPVPGPAPAPAPVPVFSVTIEVNNQYAYALEVSPILNDAHQTSVSSRLRVFPVTLNFTTCSDRYKVRFSGPTVDCADSSRRLGFGLDLGSADFWLQCRSGSQAMEFDIYGFNYNEDSPHFQVVSVRDMSVTVQIDNMIEKELLCECTGLEDSCDYDHLARCNTTITADSSLPGFCLLDPPVRDLIFPYFSGSGDDIAV